MNLQIALILVVLFLFPAVADAACTLYQHRDFGGAKYTLYDGDRLVMVNGENTGCSRSHGPACRQRTFYNASWNDHVSSFKVTDGCVLTLWQHINQGGAYFRSSKSYLFVGSRWNDQASEALCSCPG